MSFIWSYLLYCVLFWEWTLCEPDSFGWQLNLIDCACWTMFIIAGILLPVISLHCPVYAFLFGEFYLLFTWGLPVITSKITSPTFSHYSLMEIVSWKLAIDYKKKFSYWLVGIFVLGGCDNRGEMFGYQVFLFCNEWSKRRRKSRI